MNRRELLRNSAVLSTIAMLGIKPEMVLAADGDVLKIRTDGDIQILDPGYMIGGAETSILLSCMPRLAMPTVEADGKFGWVPSEWVEKVSQDDPTHISFTLKQGMAWSGGNGEVTADDVKYSLERMLKSDWSARWPTLDHVDVKDKYSGTLVLKSPFQATFLMGVATESGSILPKALVEKLKDQKFTTELPAQHGPYQMTEWTPKQKIVLKANPDWKGTKPPFGEVQFLVIEDPSAAELAYEAKEVDITGVQPATAARLLKQTPPGSKLVNQAGPFYSWIGMNTQHEKLKDIRVRKAIQRAIDVKSIIDAAYGGLAPVAHGVVPLGLIGNRKESKFSYNPDEARALLKDAGVSDLQLTFKTLNESYRVTAAQVVQANLADVGVKVDIVPVDSGPFWNLGLESKGEDWKTLEIWWMRYRTSADPSDALQWFTKNQVGVWNWERWSDPEFEDLWKKGLGELDPAKRDAIYLRMQEIMEDTGAYVWITHDPANFIYRDTITPGFDTASEHIPQNYKRS
ncbi:MAG: ABC transporter substrate-binding protein [Hyphomicrobiales bacterium]